ncbi:MAG: AarF/ABC1/UbiB kinase family protein [Saprospiraceae bacterium]|nr:AarF/ABC1/UbiB kinase family protein [Saprospiraceae bacterium]
MKEQTTIPISKVKRASKFVTTVVKVGGNYLKHYAKKAINQEVSQEDLDEENANDIYDALSELKGSALKAAQMLSMDQGVLSKAFVDKFQMAQYSAPPLSYPLVIRTFQKQLGKRPLDVFDTFSKNAVNAASIGQVHQATLNGKKLAVKVQYPGVADSVTNDLRIAKPLAARIMNVKLSDLEPYMEEVETKLLEETDYELELTQSIVITKLCAQLKNVIFPEYYPDYSGKRIIIMDWIDGMHLEEWLLKIPSQEQRNTIGQALWDFYNFQIHTLNQVHADPHPGNFLITDDLQLGVIDFGCVKVIPADFYNEYFKLIKSDTYQDEEKLVEIFDRLDFLMDSDSPEIRTFYTNIFKEAIELLGRPFRSNQFDFSDKEYFEEINTMMMGLAKNKEVRKTNGARGSKHSIYVNRVYFGLYNILHELGAEIDT